MSREGDAKVARAIGERAGDPFHHRFEEYITPGMTLGIEEDFSMPNIFSPGPLKIRAGEVVEVPRLVQHRHAAVVKVEESLQVREVVGRA